MCHWYTDILHTPGIQGLCGKERVKMSRLFGKQNTNVVTRVHTRVVKDSYRFNRMLVQIYEHCIEERDLAKEHIAKSDDYTSGDGTVDYCEGVLDVTNQIIKIIDEGGN